MKYASIRIEGGLFSQEYLESLSRSDSGRKGQKSQDFGFGNNRGFVEEVSGIWGEAKELYLRFEKRRERLAGTEKEKKESPYTTTNQYWILPFLELMDYQIREWSPSPVIEGKRYNISHRDGIPIHVVGYDKEDLGGRLGPQVSPHSLIQEYINRSDEIWGIVTNGKIFRLLRNSNLFTRQTYLEVDLEKIFTEDLFDEFLLFYRIFHRSRLPKEGQDRECLLEEYYNGTLEEGGRIRDKLQSQVRSSIEWFGVGFLQHEKNLELRNAYSKGELDVNQFYSEILYLIYRILFVLVAEERKLLGDAGNPNLRTYGMVRLRELAAIPRNDETPYDDLYQQTKSYFRILGNEHLSKLSQLPALGGELFRTRPIIDRVDLKNSIYLRILKKLLYFQEGKRMVKVNYSLLNVEELGSVYESLLDFAPHIEIEGDAEHPGNWRFVLLAGTERKSTGSHYTHSDLVAEALRQSLVPKIAEVMSSVEKEKKSEEVELVRKEKKKALLNLKVLDPSCGSGHFLLASARLIGKEIAKLDYNTEEPTPENIREGVRESIAHNIYGVDVNPLAVDLCKTALWMEGYSSGKPLSFLDSHIRCGNSLVGVFDLSVVDPSKKEAFGIPDGAYKPVGGDDKETAKKYKTQNLAESKDQISVSLFQTEVVQAANQNLLKIHEILESVDESSIANIRKKEEEFQTMRSVGGDWWKEKLACDLWTTAFFVDLTPEADLAGKISTSEDIRMLWKNPKDPQLTSKVREAERLSRKIRYFHWQLEFPFLTKQGFDVIVGNPPWEGLQLEELKYFSTRDPEIANLAGEERKSRIDRLRNTNPTLYQEYEEDKKLMSKGNQFHRESGRYPLNSSGKLNTYSLFSGLCYDLPNSQGKVSIIVPTGIATDDTNKTFFGHIVEKKVLTSLLDFENKKAIFPGVHRSYKFSILSMDFSGAKKIKTAFFLLETATLFDSRRVFFLSPEDFALFNPNTKTTPIFRTSKDYELSKKIYEKFPVLWKEDPVENPWELKFKQGLFNMTSASGKFLHSPGVDTLPLYEGKLFHQYDHRFAIYTDSENTRNSMVEEKQDPNFTITPRYWVKESDVKAALTDSKTGEVIWDRKWFLGWRDITNATNERTMLCSLMPWSGVGHTSPLFFHTGIEKTYLLLANNNSMATDFIFRSKTGGTHLTYFIIKQIPIIPPSSYTLADRKFLFPRVVELVYTSHDMRPFVDDLAEESAELGCDLPDVPYVWDEDRRALLRAEIDAYYGKLYGLSKDEMLYILDPQEAMGEDWPGETFRGLKENELREFGEYRTKQLVMEAWGRI
ncbi:MAG: hypothetical protein JJT78_18420 [Leptospira sp.]|nr:hypothetical protein [Leptospira sp.]